MRDATLAIANRQPSRRAKKASFQNVSSMPCSTPASITDGWHWLLEHRARGIRGLPGPVGAKAEPCPILCFSGLTRTGRPHPAEERACVRFSVPHRCHPLSRYQACGAPTLVTLIAGLTAAGIMFCLNPWAMKHSLAISAHVT